MIRHSQTNSRTEPVVRRQLGELLIDKEYITRTQLNEALELQAQKGHKKLIGEVLVEMNFATEQQVVEALAEGYGVPFVENAAKIADPQVVELMPREFVDEQTILPVNR